MSVKIRKSLANEMQNLDAAGLLRSEAAVVEKETMEACFGPDKCALNFLSNDFLGWRYHTELGKAAKEALAKFGTGSTSSRTSIGTLDIHKTLEQRLSDFLGVDDCLVFSSHYLAKIGLFESIAGPRDTIFIDELCNPGSFDGARLSGATIIPFKHNDMDNLEYHLKCSQSSRYRIVATDGVFYSNGECADLAGIQGLQEAYDAIAVVDDSLSIGILGERARGIFEHLHMDRKAELISGSFDYALGNVSGGFIAGQKELVQWLRLTSRSYLLSEPVSAVNAAIVLKAIDILQEDQTTLARLFANSKYAIAKMMKKAWQPSRNDYPFISIRVGSTLRAQKMVEYLYENNVLVSGLCYPNTPEGASILRFNITARHTEEQIDVLVTAVAGAFKHVDG